MAEMIGMDMDKAQDQIGMQDWPNGGFGVCVVLVSM
jgi:hypothetical protein